MTQPVNNPTSSLPPSTSATGAVPEPPRKRGGIGRIIKWTFLVLLLLVVAGGALLWVNLNRIVKHTVETQASAQLKQPSEVRLIERHVALRYTPDKRQPALA